ncbi:MAG: HAMP domain-containing sensor histidine kinase [Melioribacteraceae bacterium]
MKKIKEIFSPPAFEDPKRSREARYAHYITISITIGLFVALITNPLHESIAELVHKTVTIFVLITLFFINKKKLLKSPLLFLVIISLEICTGLMIFDQGTHDEIVLAFPIILFVASLEFNRRSLIITLIAQLAILSLVGFLETKGIFINKYSSETSIYQIISQAILLVISAYVVDLLVHDFKSHIISLQSKSVELTKANSDLNNSNATKDKFFSIIAHDLRSPFQGLIGLASILENLDDDLTPEERKDFASRLSIALKRQYDFLEELLLWGQFQRNVIDFAPLLCGIKEIIERDCEIFSGNLYKKKLQLTVDCPEEIKVRCDENLISTVIRNLISNAIKYTLAGGIITVKVEELSDKIFISVIDNGIGISETRRKELFSIESNSSTRGTEGEAGTGLGLILCKEIMDRHSGKIMAVSEEGKGSTFKIELPKNLESL